jgi:hypothetical protein
MLATGLGNWGLGRASEARGLIHGWLTTSRQKEHGSPQLRAVHSDASSTTIALGSRSNRQLSR